MPLSDHKGQDRAGSEDLWNSSTSKPRQRLAIPVPILRGAAKVVVSLPAYHHSTPSQIQQESSETNLEQGLGVWATTSSNSDILAPPIENAVSAPSTSAFKAELSKCKPDSIFEGPQLSQQRRHETSAPHPSMNHPPSQPEPLQPRLLPLSLTQQTDRISPTAARTLPEAMTLASSTRGTESWRPPRQDRKVRDLDARMMCEGGQAHHMEMHHLKQDCTLPLPNTQVSMRLPLPRVASQPLLELAERSGRLSSNNLTSWDRISEDAKRNTKRIVLEKPCSQSKSHLETPSDQQRRLRPTLHQMPAIPPESTKAPGEDTKANVKRSEFRRSCSRPKSHLETLSDQQCRLRPTLPQLTKPSHDACAVESNCGHHHRSHRTNQLQRHSMAGSTPHTKEWEPVECTHSTDLPLSPYTVPQITPSSAYTTTPDHRQPPQTRALRVQAQNLSLKTESTYVPEKRRSDAASPATRSPESSDDSPPMSPQSVTSSLAASHATPMTSPSRSPTKGRPSTCRFGAFVNSLVQLDGPDDDDANELSLLADRQCSPDDESEDEVIFFEVDGSTEASDDVFFDSASRVHGHTSSVCDNNMGETAPQHRKVTSSQIGTDDFTPLVAPSFGKGAAAFPFPRHPGRDVSTSMRRQSRYPSVLLGHCERNATPRQKRLMTGGTQTPDRFIPSRAGTPTKQSLLLTKQRAKPWRATVEPDPFGPVPARSLRMAEQYATIRSPAPPPHPVGTATRVTDASAPPVRAPSLGTVWTVGGALVTEGVASITNGRGGRITSGTNAPHYTADFIRKNAMTEDEVTHSKRLALAMDIDQNAKMMVQSSPTTPASHSGSEPSPNCKSRVWKDGIWQQAGVMTRT